MPHSMQCPVMPPAPGASFPHIELMHASDSRCTASSTHYIASNLTLPARPRPLSHPLQGSSPLQIEKRDGPGGSYGQGRKQSMTLAQFLQRMAAGDDTLYLTTQQVRGHMLLLGKRAGTSGHFGHGGSETI